MLYYDYLYTGKKSGLRREDNLGKFHHTFNKNNRIQHTQNTPKSQLNVK